MPSDPLRLQIIDRVVDVLDAIRAGDDYFYSPHDVIKRDVHPNECKGYPTYMVFADIGEAPEFAGTNLYDEDMILHIFGVIKDEVDPVTRLERAVRDVRKAINDDSKGQTAGTLGVLAVTTEILSPETGYDSEGFGYFRLRARIKISGDYGEL